MSEHRILLIENPAHLSVNLQRLKISRHDYDDVFVAPGDIAVLLLHDPSITLTHRLLQLLSEHGVVVMSTNAQHMPCAMQWPLIANVQYVSRLAAQITYQQSPLNDLLWQQLIRCRIDGQIAHLVIESRSGVRRLKRLAASVKPGDPDNCEGQAARHFWQHWLAAPHKRHKLGAEDGVNAALNFGYAVIRACICRATVGAGLNPAIGIHHRSSENPLNLVDDLLEAYRFLVERNVYDNIESFNTFDTEGKRIATGVVGTTITMAEQTFRLPAAIQATVNSYVRVLKQGCGQLQLPLFDSN